jgi:undecaprenyl diphosphate synthase
MALFSKLLNQMTDKLTEKGVRVRVVGRREDFSPELQNKMKELEEASSGYTSTTIWIALSYGGRAEILEAVNQAIATGEVVTEESFSSLLWSADMPDPDMIIRTSGEHRLSNFLPWQSVYSELYFIEKHWPTLTKSDFEDILLQYETRERRHGS